MMLLMTRLLLYQVHSLSFLPPQSLDYDFSLQSQGDYILWAHLGLPISLCQNSIYYYMGQTTFFLQTNSNYFVRYYNSRPKYSYPTIPLLEFFSSISIILLFIFERTTPHSCKIYFNPHSNYFRNDSKYLLT